MVFLEKFVSVKKQNVFSYNNLTSLPSIKSTFIKLLILKLSNKRLELISLTAKKSDRVLDHMI